MIAALFIERGGPYWDLPGVDPWDKERDDMIRAAKPVRPDMAQMDSEDDRDRMDLMMLRARRVVRREVLSRLVEVLVVPSKGCLALAVVVSIGERDAENIKCVTNPGDP